MPGPSSDEHTPATTATATQHHRSISPVQVDDSSASDDEEEFFIGEPIRRPRRSRPSRSRSRSRSQSPRTGKEGRDLASVDTDFRTLVSTMDFWLCFTYLGLCAGIGLMFINNIGTQVATFLIGENPRTVAASQVRSSPRSAKVTNDDSGLNSGQNPLQAHLVSLLSICNCLGRLAAGFSADHFTHHVSVEWRFQRIWWYVPTALLFVISQLFARGADGVDSLLLPTALTGFAYGAMFALSPIVCLERFGVRFFATNNGLLTLAPSVFGNLLNGLFGILYDAKVDHSKGHTEPTTFRLLSRSFDTMEKRAGGEIDHSHLCLLGKECFRAAFNVSTLMAVGALVVGLVLARRSSMHAS
ncbi:BQ5605_C007g04484 [Microbotryum silenes-dioicae]|uniref:BQ5605_C007g04484 protein n=1 Tax=Microbotryum silenes-dioicae TaxID=796604 RepID=A0A2X0MBA5_9BASI|nr:BQ5605_C007g04484 [Microbotryum silenes-dioicae]